MAHREVNIEEIQCVGREIVALLLRHLNYSQWVVAY